MTDTGIFKHIWRINAVLFLVVSCSICYLLGQDVVDSGFFQHGSRRSPTAAPDNTLRLSHPIPVANGAYYLYVYSPGGRSYREGIWFSEPARNIMVVDAQSNASHWLLPDTTHSIVQWEEIIRGAECGFESVGVRLDCVEADRNDDGILDGRDGLTCLVSAGFEYEPRDLVGEPVADFWCTENDGRLFCQFSSTAGMETALFALDENMTLINRSVLPEISTRPNAAGEAGGG